MRLQGKTALIAGASRNIGKTIALTFAREGADLILVANKSVDDLKRVAKECEDLGVQALAIQADVSNHLEVNRMVQQGLGHFGKVDVLVCVAGIRPHKPFLEISYEEWHHVLAVNLNPTFYLAKALAPGMMERKSGSIIALGGTAAMTAHRDRAHVVASKRGLHGLVQSLALELGPYGVRANMLVAGFIDTKRNPEWHPETGAVPLEVAELVGTPLKRMGMPQEVANVAVFLASEESSYVTGDRVVCAGGRYM